MSKQNMKGLIKLCNELISKNINIVLDADAINLDLIKTLNRDSYSDIGQVVLTPHLGEFERISRMRPKSESEKIDAVKNFAEKYHLTILLKQGLVVYLAVLAHMILSKQADNYSTKLLVFDLLQL